MDREDLDSGDLYNSALSKHYLLILPVVIANAIAHNFYSTCINFILCVFLLWEHLAAIPSISASKFVGWALANFPQTLIFRLWAVPTLRLCNP
ncbi:hypothetical protein ACF3DV_04200 [Chlorogloeopsis fritschii PCC 9212]|uniref:hypothetical protein n=1 Tax=Chlorogloeopsis fritschii TaxID=1124 RepID=UPI00036FD4AB|nr:hypothetical protein [Chlorogloeopsis fritschii]